VKDLKTETAAWKALELLNINPNTDFSGQAGPPTKFGELTEIYRRKELVLDAYSTQQVYGLNIDNWILPKWRNYALRQLEETPGRSTNSGWPR
jgi:hypothetical protein